MLSRTERLLKLAAIYELECLAAQYAEGLKNSLQSYLGINILPEAWTNWIEVNRNSISNISAISWNDLKDEGMEGIFCQLGDTWVIMSSSQHVNDYYDLSKQTLLKGTSGIPNLYLSFITKKNVYEQEDILDPNTPISPDIAHYAWVFEAIEQMAGDIEYAMARNEDIVEFIRKNKNTLNKIRQHFKSQPRALGSGADGTAFDIGGNNVLKIFTDTFAYNKARDAIKRLHGNPDLARTEAMIYDAGEIGEINGYPIYYTIMEKLKNIPLNLHQPLTEVLECINGAISLDEDQLQRIKRQINERSKSTLIRNVVKRKAEQIAEKIRHGNYYHVQEVADIIEDTGVSMKDNWFELLIEEVLMKYLTGRTDLHVGNIGITENGELRYFDPAYSGTQSGELNLG